MTVSLFPEVTIITELNTMTLDAPYVTWNATYPAIA